MREFAAMIDEQEQADEARAYSEIGPLLHERLRSGCWYLFSEGNYRHAAREAMAIVELSLREKALATDAYFGTRLIDLAFSNTGAVQLTSPFGGSLQDEARALFKGAFRYYRNYAAHDGSQIDRTRCARILILASELLDLLAASPRSLRLEGGPEGLVAKRVFTSVADLRRFLIFIQDQNYPDDVWDGFYEALALAGFSEEQLELIIDLALLERTCEWLEPSQDLNRSWPEFETVTVFRLTELGREVLKSLPEPIKENGAA
jgi:uncharacterized protein (TIGR02391 family)